MKKSHCFRNRPILYVSMGFKAAVKQYCVKFGVIEPGA
jgi:hypothetical protein